MPRYAVVKILEDESPRWTKFRAAYEIRCEADGKLSTLRCCTRPALSSFGNFLLNDAGDVEISQITEQHAARWLAAIRKQLKASTYRTRLAVLRAAFEWARGSGMIHSNVFKDFELPPMPFAGRVLSEAEIKSLLSALPAKCARMVTVYLYTGLRAKELTTLQWWQVRDDHICIPADKEKSSRGRCIPIDDRVKFHLGRRGGEFDKVAEVCYDTLRETIVKAAKALALGRIKIHDFRHTCVTRFFEHSDDVWAACDIFGWADPKSAEPYIHMTKKRRAKVLHISYPCLEQSPGPGPLPS